MFITRSPSPPTPTNIIPGTIRNGMSVTTLKYHINTRIQMIDRM